jgi:AcrR family transcriptional regulator
MKQKIKHSASPGTPQWWLSRSDKNAKAAGPGRPSISFDKIIATAQQTIDEVGVEAFTLRMLAERLESGTATLYRHAASKAEIFAYVVDRFLGSVPLGNADLSKLTWQQGISGVALVLYRLLRAHPNMVPLLVSQVPIGPNALKNRERALQVLLNNGFSPSLAARAYTTVAHYVIGFAIQQKGAGVPGSVESGELARFYRTLDQTSFPATFKLAEHLPGTSVDDEFLFGLQLIVDGLNVKRQSTRSKQAAA